MKLVQMVIELERVCVPRRRGRGAENALSASPAGDREHGNNVKPQVRRSSGFRAHWSVAGLPFVRLDARRDACILAGPG
jgi:hypothetical protein